MQGSGTALREKLHESRPQSDERTQSAQLRADCDAEQPFDAALAEGGFISEV